MKKSSITIKLFTITSIFFMILLSTTFIFQSLFFEKFYYSEKKHRLIKNVENFKHEYVKINSISLLAKYIYQFEDANNSKMVIITKNGMIKTSNNSISNIPKDRSNEVIFLALDHWLSSEENYFDVLLNKSTISFNFKNPVLNTNNLVVVSPVMTNNSINEIIFVISTLQPVGEAASIMKKYYIYIFIGTLILIAILSLIYSKMISTPLIELNNTATKMANLDFSAKCNIKSNDEIGNLASTLNFLSHNLNKTLSELKYANIKLKQDIEKEKELEKMRKEFIAGVSHELKTPISLIEGYAEGLIDGIVDEKDIEYYLNVIIDESKKMDSLVKDMLDLSRLESGTFMLNLSEFNIYDFINSIYRVHSKNIKDKKLNLNCNIQNKNILVYADEFRIEEVITNLISNAIRYTPKNKNIYINLIDNDDRILIEIENEGANIEENELKYIWNKFYRIDKSRNKDLGGTGLGLAIVKNILELHNSEYGIVNTEKGVKAYFYLNKC
ncbi:alkaline phosphatase synthesis sensor protein PhoR [Clostridium tepidiprofundi DSM 19306]|uniref:histidine kinase n=1 Tax=Clostridium tepidiprofundi DSM 19306 TaxID=1121338 RepID=A0A151ATB2_9CLOT|nr:alkaline phosphatase synthesis sensor protein PhoR [Clostridium tepidiprofundi DSM 19306]